MTHPARRLLLACAAVALAACAPAEPEAPPPRFKQPVHLNEYERDFGYAQAVRIDKTLYVSGTVAVDGEGRLIGQGSMEAQLRAVYANLARTLASQELGFEHVVRETVYVTDMDAFLAARAVRLEFHSRESLPAATFVEVRRLADPGFLVAVDLVAEAP